MVHYRFLNEGDTGAKRASTILWCTTDFWTKGIPGQSVPTRYFGATAIPERGGYRAKACQHDTMVHYRFLNEGVPGQRVPARYYGATTIPERGWCRGKGSRNKSCQ